MPTKIPTSTLQRIALQRQGLLKADHFGRGTRGVLAAIRQLGYVQIDSISVVQRAHHHVLWNRVGNYQPGDLESLLATGQVFEYWFHAAAYLPIEHYRFALPRMHAIKSGEKHWFTNTSKKLMHEICARIKSEGPLMARDFKDPVARQNGWWDWKPAKQALEQLFIQGDLMIVERVGFQKRYDLRSRVLPDTVDTRMPTVEEEATHLIDLTLRAHGFATLKSFTYLRKGLPLRQCVRDIVEQRVADGRLQKLLLPDEEHAYCEPGVLSKVATTGRRVSLLSPFDNSVIQRARCRSVFDFDYQIECYVPPLKRKHGYFCLPILSGRDFIGRVDCKADRTACRLDIVSLHIESDINAPAIDAMVGAIVRFAVFNQCTQIGLHQVRPTRYKKQLTQLLRAKELL